MPVIQTPAKMASTRQSQKFCSNIRQEDKKQQPKFMSDSTFIDKETFPQ